MQKSFLTLCFVTYATNTFAGNISSGGGELLGDAQNPWFIEAAAGEPMSPQIKYCIEVGPDFVVAKDKLKLLTRASISWWDSQFSSAHIPENEFQESAQTFLKFRVKVQTSRFIEQETCNADTDIRFQYGYLSESQLADLKEESIDPTKFVGMTIRTDYSRKMRGKGYIYISPDRGSLAMRSPTVMPNVWSIDDGNFNNNIRLKSIIMHELGHIFGVPHTISGLMDAKAPERLTSINLESLGSLYQYAKPIFFPGSINIDVCDRKNYSILYQFFNVPEGNACVGMYSDLNSIRIWSKKTASDSQEFIAQKTLTDGYSRRFRDLIALTLPSERDVYTKIPEFYKSLKGPDVTEILQNIILRVNGKEVSLFIQRDPDRYQIGGILNGKLVPDLYSYGSHWGP